MKEESEDEIPEDDKTEDTMSVVSNDEIVKKKPIKKVKKKVKKPSDDMDEVTRKLLEMDVERTELESYEPTEFESGKKEVEKPKKLGAMKLVPMKIERKQFKPTKMIVTEPEKPQQITLRRTKMTPKQVIEESKLPLVLLKSRIVKVEYPPEIQHMQITDLNSKRANGILMRAEEVEEEKRKTKKVKKFKAPKDEKPELEELEIYEEEEVEKPEPKEEEKPKYERAPKEKPEPEEIETRTLKLGKGKVPQEESPEEIIKLKKTPQKPEPVELVEEKPKPKPEEPEQPKEVEKPKKQKQKITPLEPLEFPESEPFEKEEYVKEPFEKPVEEKPETKEKYERKKKPKVEVEEPTIEIVF